MAFEQATSIAGLALKLRAWRSFDSPSDDCIGRAAAAALADAERACGLSITPPTRKSRRRSMRRRPSPMSNAWRGKGARRSGGTPPAEPLLARHSPFSPSPASAGLIFSTARHGTGRQTGRFQVHNRCAFANGDQLWRPALIRYMLITRINTGQDVGILPSAMAITSTTCTMGTYTIHMKIMLTSMLSKRPTRIPQDVRRRSKASVTRQVTNTAHSAAMRPCRTATTLTT
jgi:hypothetical protein